MLSGEFGVELLVDPGDHPQKQLLVHGFGQSTYCIIHLESHTDTLRIVRGRRETQKVNSCMCAGEGGDEPETDPLPAEEFVLW